MVKFLCAGLLVSSVSSVVVLAVPAAQTHQLKTQAGSVAWQWTLDERLRLRYDREHMRQRRLAAAQDDPAPGGEAQAIEKVLEQEGQVVVFGSMNPELLLPWELFQQLISTAFSLDQDTRDVWRQVYQQRGPGLRLDEVFWDRLGTTAEVYIASMQSQRRAADRALQTGNSPDQTEEREKEGTRVCRLMIETLDDVRQVFGEEHFDRILYEAVAPGFFVIHSVNRGMDDLRFVTGGCR